MPADLLRRLHEANALAWEDMPDGLAREVREALAGEPTDDRRACWTCKHDFDGDGRGICLLTKLGQRHVVSDWIRDNCDMEPLPGARNCPGWAPKESR